MLIYKLTNRVNGKSYIGQTRSSLATRMRQWRHDAEKGLNYLLPTAIREFGWENFEASVLAFCSSVEEMNDKERAAILVFNTLDPFGYNRSFGGPGLLGRPVSAETRAKISKANTGKTFVQTPAQYAKLCERAKERRGSNNLRAHPITYHGVTYGSIVEASAVTGLSRAQMQLRLKKGIATYAGAPRCIVPGNGAWNREHPTLTPWSDERKAAQSRTKRGAGNWNARQVEVDGVVYPSGTDAMQATGLTRMMLRTRLKRGTARYLTESKFAQ